jgi:uncharacterized protein (DUF302 family)
MSSYPQEIEHDNRRLVVPLPQSYDEARDKYERLAPIPDFARFNQAPTWDAVLELAKINAPFGFMIYYRSDVTSIMATSHSHWKCTEYLMGNHTIAERMFRYDPSIMLHAPLRTAIYADHDGDTHIAVDQPSLLFASYGDDRISAVGRELDGLLAGLLKELNAPVPDALCTRSSHSSS